MAGERRHVQRLQLRVSEDAIGGTALGHGMLFEQAPVWSEDGDSRARSVELPTACRDDVAVSVEGHAVDAAHDPEVVQHLVVAEAATVRDRIRAKLSGGGLVVVALRDVERALIEREQNPIRTRGVEGDAFDLPGSGTSRRGEAVDRVMVNLAITVV